MVARAKTRISSRFATPSLDLLRQRIRGLGNDGAKADIRQNLALIREISAPSHILGVLREVMSNDLCLEDVAARSYRHVSHFDKIVLVEAEIENGYRLTFHLWDPPYSNEDLADELIHDHRFSFWSSILTGILTSRQFIPDPSGTVFRTYQYTPENASADNFYAFQGERRLVEMEPTVETVGGAYFLRFDTTHKVILPRQNMTCTLVLRSPRARGYSNVYNTTYPTTDTTVSNVMFSGDELFSRLARIYAAIESTRPDRPAVVRRVFEPVTRAPGA